ncbi:MAG: hypothetical protein E7668_07195 [Ruminococcaceae bacterium]|nr:hypothetical protein [Oscillospiraceae bacterium]
MEFLYGDGIHDDTKAIQERIDNAGCELILPAPQAFYLISKPLELPSNFRLVLPRFAEVRLADQSNCVMVRNRLPYDPDPSRLPEFSFDKNYLHNLSYVVDYSDAEPSVNIELCGGIWNCNNQGQIPNPIYTGEPIPVKEFWGYGMLFYNVRNLKLSDLTLKDPTNFAVTLDTVSYFTVENITFDFNYGNPKPINMDGIHCNGNCHYGVIRNLKGACYDDLVALNADEGRGGPITHIEIDGLFAEECHSAVRLLAVRQKVEHIHISNVYGTYYQYCIGVTKFYPGPTTGGFDALSFDHIFAAKSPRHDYIYPNPDCAVYPLIYISGESVVKRLSMDHIHRREHCVPIETIRVGTDTKVEQLILSDIVTENHTDEPMPLLVNKGKIRKLVLTDVDAGADEKLLNIGSIEMLIER